MSIPEFTIVTPVCNGMRFIRQCHSSVSDQEGVTVEHVIVDGLSTDGTVEWLNEQKELDYVSEADNGMYDAINKGIYRAKGKIVAYLNCDEQYLPGTLWTIAQYFDQNPRWT